MTLLDAFRRRLADLLPPGAVTGRRALVAVSGGPDSVALLDLLARTAPDHGLDLVVAHADHGIHRDSARVADAVRDLAARYGLPFECGRLALGPGASETAARESRYAWLAATRERLGADFVFTAHHADDQTETVLMRLLAGSGPAGLAGIEPRAGRLVRPLLGFRREELAAHVAAAGLAAWSDPANADPRHLRSWIRSEVLPALRSRIPAVDDRLRRAGTQAASDRAAWDAALDLLPGLDLREESDGISLAAAALAGYPPSLAEAAVMAAARRAGHPLGPVRAGRALALARRGGSGGVVPLGGGSSAELAFGRLRLLLRRAAVAEAAPWLLRGEEGERDWGGWRFRWRQARPPARQPRAGLTAWFLLDALEIRTWAAGDRVRPLAGRGSRLVVRCFQDARIPRSRRAGWPVVAHGGSVVWVPGVCRSELLLPAAGTEALRVDAEPA